MEAAVVCAAFGTPGNPLTGFEHAGFVVLLDKLAAVQAEELTVVGELVDHQHLLHAAVRARHVVAALVAVIVGRADGAGILDGGGADAQDFPPHETRRAAQGLLFGAALVVQVSGVLRQLIEDQVHDRHRRQRRRTVGAAQHQHAAREFLHQGGVAAVAAARRRDALLQHGHQGDGGR